MMDFFQKLFTSGGFMPHGHCYLWKPGILWLHILSDALITLAYFSIPFTLVYFVRKRRDLEFNWMFICFAVFIIACGTTHLMEIWVIWHPTYWLSGAVKGITALASVPTAFLLLRLVPEALRLPSPSALRKVNLALEKEVSERKAAELDVRRLNDGLERRVEERTAQLAAANRFLENEIEVRRSAEQALRESRQYYQTLTESLPQLIWTCTADGRCDYLSRQWTDYTGRPAEEQLGYGWTEQVHPDDRVRVQQAWEKTISTGEPLDVEFRIRRADRVYRWFKTRAVPIRDDNGRIIRWFGSNTEVDDFKVAESSLRSHVERLNLLARITRAIGQRQDLPSIFQIVINSLEENLPIDFGCVCLHDPVKHSLTVAGIGVKSKELATQLSLPERVPFEMESNGFERCFSGESICEGETANLNSPFARSLAQGGLHAMVVAPLQVESQIFGLLVAARREPSSFTAGDCEFLRQLTEHVALAAHQVQLYGALQRAYDDLRQTQQTIMQQERLSALGQMASGIAHDINNAISPVALYTESLLEKETNLSQRAREYLQTIRQAIQDVAETVSRMREFYRAREPQLTLKAVNLSRLLQQVLDLTRARWHDVSQQQGIVIRAIIESGENLPPIVGVESELREALINLVFNAVDAMPQGGTLTLRTISTAKLEGNGDDTNSAHVCIEVADTGVGMNEDTRQRCLEPFFTTKGERGTGLGLAMVYGTVQRHRGEIEVESRPGQGTVVRLSFPVAANGSAEAISSTGSHRTRSRLRLLIVDDDPLLLKSLRDILEADGHVVVTAGGGQDGMDLFQRAYKAGEAFDAVVTDLGMPYMDGRQVAKFIKETSPDTFVILLTGWAQRLFAEGDVPPHVDCVLSKPPKLRELRESLGQVHCHQSQ